MPCSSCSTSLCCFAALSICADVCAAGKAAGVDCNILREYVTPEQLLHFQSTGQWPAEHGLCVLCARAAELEHLARLVKVAEDYVFSLKLEQVGLIILPIFPQAVCARAQKTGAAARESLWRDRPGGLTSPALYACGSATHRNRNR